MTIVDPPYRWKKELKKALYNEERVYFNDPSIYAPQHKCSSDMKPGDHVLCRHPDWKWVAQVTRTNDGWEVS